MTRQIHIVFWLCLLACVSCESRSEAQQTGWFSGQGSFLVLPGATRVEHTTAANPTVTFSLSEPYPANDTLRTFEDRLGRAGWRPLSGDTFNPRSDAMMRRWGVAIVDAEPQLRWIGQWVNEEGAVVSMSLSYRTKRGGGNQVVADGPLDVYIVLVSKEKTAR